MASLMFPMASCSSFPCDTHPGRAGHCATIQPSSAFSSETWKIIWTSILNLEFNTRSRGQASEVRGRRRALLRFGGQSILSFLTEDSDANRCGREVVQRGNHRRKYFLCLFVSFFFSCGEYAGTRPESRPAI